MTLTLTTTTTTSDGRVIETPVTKMVEEPVPIPLVSSGLDVHLDLFFRGLHPGFFPDTDRLRMEGFLAFVELFDEFLDAIFVVVGLAFGFGDAFVHENDLEAGVKRGSKMTRRR